MESSSKHQHHPRRFSWRRNHIVRPIETSPMDDRSAQAIRYLSDDCPAEVLPLILAFCGPQQTLALSRVSKQFHKQIITERTFRVLCEELYKWSPGQAEPESWKDYYTMNPCIPIDFSSIPKAVATITESPKRTGRNNATYQTKSLRILLRPGTYYLREAIAVQTYERVEFSMETMELPTTLYTPPVKAITEISEQPLPHSNSRKNRPASFRSLFACHQSSTSDESDTDDMMDLEDSFEAASSTASHAKLVLRTRKPNEPVFTIRQGGITLKRLDIEHLAPGVDIWNGNAAVQIQPPVAADGTPVPVLPPPFCTMESCTVSSKSGRGIVNIDGGRLTIDKCMVMDCAATGIYIGGPGSSAEITNTDVLRNGVGNRRTRRGIARGHSGIYLEQGEATILNSNVSDNTLTGISVVSPDNAVLNLRDSSLVANGTFQLELPAPGTRSHQQSSHENNQLEFLGVAPLRSGLSQEG